MHQSVPFLFAHTKTVILITRVNYGSRELTLGFSIRLDLSQHARTYESTKTRITIDISILKQKS